jgi:succinate dehydrogenase / fumarate reductase flavoprotein subunit
MREDLMAMLDIQELEKYFTSEELANHPARRS